MLYVTVWYICHYDVVMLF